MDTDTHRYTNTRLESAFDSALRLLGEAGVDFTVVDRCDRSGCVVCDRGLAAAAA